MSVIHDSVPDPGPIPRQQVRFPGKCRIVFVGRLAPSKQVHVLIRAFAGVMENMATVQYDCELVIAGNGEEKAALEQLCASLGIGDHVFFPGCLDHAEVYALYRTADIFCMPSSTEGLCSSILEAMAHSLPVVASRVGGIPEAVTHGLTGLLVPSGDVVALANSLASIISSPARQIEMGNAGRRAYEQCFSPVRNLQKYVALYDRLRQTQALP